MKLFKYFLLSLSSVAVVNAATLSFGNGGGDNLWSTAANWGGTLPTASDDGTNWTHNVTVSALGMVARKYDLRNNYLLITTGGNLQLSGALALARGGGATGNHDVRVEGSGIFQTTAINFSTGGSNDTVSEVRVSGTGSFTVTGNINQSNAHGSFTYTQTGGTSAVNGNFNVGTRASATTAKDYQVDVSGTSTLSYGTANWGTVAANVAATDTLINLTDSNYAITATTATNLGLDSQTTFTFDSSGIGTWNAAALTIDAGADFIVDIAAISGTLSYGDQFDLISYTSLVNPFDFTQFTVTNNASGLGAYVYDNGSSIYLFVAPEPSSMALLAIGLTSLAFTRRRKA